MQIVGMNNCKERLARMSKLPHLTIMSAPIGAGKTLLIKRMAEEYNLRLVHIGNKIDDIRNLIQDSVSLEQPTLFAIGEGDSMSLGAKNALLKITEEPPRNCHIVMEIRDISTVLETIISRGTIFEIDKYSYKELKRYAIEVLGMSDDEDTSNICQISTTPGDVKVYMEVGYKECFNFAQTVYNYIMKVTTGNAFKIKNRIDFTGKGKGFPIDMFFNVLNFVCRQNINQPQALYIMECTIKALNALKVNGANKEMAFDIWVLDCRLRRGEYYA